jgi:tetratricopeptide (TPR) repeat protein
MGFLDQQRQALARSEAAIAAECAKSPWGLRVERIESIRIGEAAGAAESFLEEMLSQATGEKSFRTDTLQVARLGSTAGELTLIRPWSVTQPMPHEIFSISPGALPWPVVLKWIEDAVLNPWAWDSLKTADPIVAALDALGRKMTHDLTVSAGWASSVQYFKVDWGIQAVPMDRTRFFFMTQSMPSGLLGGSLGLDSHLEKRRLFRQTIDPLRLDGPFRPEFIRRSNAQEFIEREFPELVASRKNSRADELAQTARRLLEAQKYPAAARTAEEAVQAQPDHAEAQQARALAKQKLEEVEGLTRQSKESAKKGEWDQAAELQERLMALFDKDKEKTRALQAELTSINERRARMHFQAAQTLIQQGKKAEAAERLKIVLSLTPRNAVARQMLEGCQSL